MFLNAFSVLILNHRSILGRVLLMSECHLAELQLVCSLGFEPASLVCRRLLLISPGKACASSDGSENISIAFELSPGYSESGPAGHLVVARSQ